MDTSVKKTELLAILKKNRTQHHAVFLKAVENYRAAMLTELEQHIKRIKNGKALRVIISLPTPEEHLDDYDRAIQMVTLDTRSEILLSERDAEHLIQDQWGWMDSFQSNTSSYIADADGQ